MLTLLHNDALTALQTLDDESVQCVVTSPPYWGLRDYGLEPCVWDAMVECEHKFIDRAVYKDSPTRSGDEGVGFHNADVTKSQRWKVSGTCHCGAWRGCLGLEPTPELYVQHIVQVFREVKRVLRPDGTLWLNLGDSYASAWACGRRNVVGNGSMANGKRNGRGDRLVGGLKEKDLVGIPWMVAFALRADGWYLRSDIIWSKPNPMPESVTDRPTKSHEYIFLLSKSQKYYYDQNAIREPWTCERDDMREKGVRTGLAYLQQGPIAHNSIPASHKGSSFTKGKTAALKPNVGNGERVDNPMGRNRRSVWPIATAPFPEAHFATFPTEIPTICILAGSKAGDTVLDPFAGSGTTGKVAIELGRKAILIEPKDEYVEMIERRCKTTIGLPLAI